MKIAIIGSGGREHALASTISKSSSVKEIFCIPRGIFEKNQKNVKPDT